jgi:hypothetical protein
MSGKTYLRLQWAQTTLLLVAAIGLAVGGESWVFVAVLVFFVACSVPVILTSGRRSAARIDAKRERERG